MRPADVEADLLAVLESPAATRVPQSMPPAFTRVSRAGGARINLAQSRPTVLIECWALTDWDAQQRAFNAWQAIDSAFGGSTWGGTADLSEPVAYPDPNTPTHHRYQFTASVVAALLPN